MKTNLLKLLLIVCQFTFAQHAPVENYLSPAGLLETNFDSFGNKYLLEDLYIKSNANFTIENAGIFELYFENGSGMETTTNALHNQKRTVVNKVFQDVSNFLNSPLKNSANAPKVKILIRNFTSVQNQTLNAIAFGTSFYNVAKNNSTAGIIDNQLWKMVNSGVDPYHKVTFAVNDDNTPVSFFHAAFAFNPTLNWSTSLTTAPTANQYDLYTFALREIVHALGFNSLIAQDGTSKLGTDYNFYSRFDTFIANSNNIKLIVNPQGCSFSNGYIFNGDLSDLGTNCNNNSNANPCSKTNYFAGTNQVKLASPNCFDNQISFQFVNKNCNNSLTNNWLVDNTLGKGDLQRSLNLYERQILIDLGYGFTSSFGQSSNLNYLNYNSSVASNTVVGINDGFDFLNSISGTVNQSITLTNLLGNDVNATHFECLQDLTDSNAVFSNITGNNTTNPTITSTKKGSHLLSYVPYNAVTGKRGNITYIYLYIEKVACPIQPTCNLVPNGDFEINIGIPDPSNLDPNNPFDSTFDNLVCNWFNANLTGTADYFHTNASPASFGIPINQASLTPNPTNTNFPGSRQAYAGIAIDRIDDSLGNISNGNEVIRCRLNSPLSANKQYKLSFHVLSPEGALGGAAEIQACLVRSTGVPPYNFNGSTQDYIPPTGSIFLGNGNFIQDKTQWHEISFTFTTGTTANQNHLIIGGLVDPFINSTLPPEERIVYYYIDNVSLTEVSPLNPILNIQPKTFCVTAPSFDLNNYLTGGVTGGFFSINGVPIAGSTFNPATVGMGTHTITYTIPEPIACPAIVISDTITINSCTPAQPPYISQVYASATNDKFVEVKNKDNTTAIGTGQYFLALYANGAPTTGAPTSFVDLGAIPANGVKVFKANLATTPWYAVTGATPFNLLENYTGTNDLLLITTSTGTNAYNDRIDVLGDTTGNSIFYKNYTQETYASLVRVSCTPMGYPRTDYDEQDWVGFDMTSTNADDNEILAGNKINGELGRHWSEDLTWNGISWVDISPDLSNPDRSRVVLINQPYSTGIASFEACSLVSSFPLTITSNKNVKVQTSVDSTVPNGIDVQDKGALVMVRDCYYGVCNENLVSIVSQNSMKHSRTTSGLNTGIDYVYWSSPINNINPLNKKAGQIFNFGNALGQFDPSRFFRFENQNFYDAIINPSWGVDNSSGTDGYDDDAGFNQNPATIDYLPFSQIPNAMNEPFIPGRGYVTWPAKSSFGYFTPYSADYTITFEGEMNNGVIKVPVYRNDSVFGANPNLIGNPYPSAINLKKFLDFNSNLIEPIAFIWGRGLSDNPSTGNQGPDLYNYKEDNYLLYNPYMIIDNTFSNNLEFNDVLPIDERGILSSCQSFFVRAHDPAGGFATLNTGYIEMAGEVTFSNGMRTEKRNDTFAKMVQNSNTSRITTQNTIQGKIWINLTDQAGYKVQTGVVFDTNAHTNYYRGEDIKTITGRKYNLYSQASNEDLVINVQDAFNTDKVIPLGITNVSGNTQQVFTISVPKKEGIFSTQEIYLYDATTNMYHNLSNGNFTFTSNEAIIENRFSLVFSNNLLTLTNKITDNQLIIYNNNGVVIVKSQNENIKNVTVTDIYNIKNENKTVNNKLNTKIIEIPVNEDSKLLNITVTLENGTVINKKIYR